ncbi:CQS_1a_G0000900.mRNA.1.CDS.1 [Saccharomyces cerevisiae]|nr:CQS_1a_G0000900.mRNA.1.CDS.1 [Saccharomyces cerevisiae]CAI7129403.1 CQS_1a_G0000900.mRNA.1.CDS.1 [Saccharomyces cerevisiae]
MIGSASDSPSKLGRLRFLSETAAIKVSPLILGEVSYDGARSDFLKSMNKNRAFELLDTFYEAGGNFIGATDNCQNEQSEEWIGEWIQSRRLRDQIVIATKFIKSDKKYKAGESNTANYCGNHKRSLHVSVRDSLRKLQTDWIDILYVHWWDYMSSIEEFMDSLHILVQQGKVLYLGVSDTPAWIVSAANYYATSHGKTPFSIYQGKWNVLNRDFERGIIRMARHFGMALAPWDVMGGGRFQSKKAIEERKKEGEGLRSFFGGSEQTDVEVRISEALLKVAEEHGIESVTAIAIAYVRSRAKNVFSSVEGGKIEDLKENIKALSIDLTPDNIKYLESVVPFDIGFPNNFIVLNSLTQKIWYE